MFVNPKRHKSSLMTVPFEDLKEKSRECIPHLEHAVISKVNQLTFLNAYWVPGTVIMFLHTLTHKNSMK